MFRTLQDSMATQADVRAAFGDVTSGVRLAAAIRLRLWAGFFIVAVKRVAHPDRRSSSSCTPAQTQVLWLTGAVCQVCFCLHSALGTVGARTVALSKLAS